MITLFAIYLLGVGLALYLVRRRYPNLNNAQQFAAFILIAGCSWLVVLVFAIKGTVKWFIHILERLD